MHPGLGHDAFMNTKVKRRNAAVRAFAAIVAAAALAGALAAGITGCVTTTPPAPPPPPREPTESDITFEAISQRYMNEMMALTPVNATSLGNHRFDGELDDVSTKGYDRRDAL